MTLLLRGASTKLRSKGGLTALDIAKARNHQDVVEFLQIATGDICNNLIDAAKQGDTEAVTKLLNAGEDIHQRNDAGETALHQASKEGRLEVARILLARGASPHLTTVAGLTPLDVARENRREELVSLLQAAALAATY